MPTDLKIQSTRDLLLYFRDSHKINLNRRFCFVLGSGASKQSGIPTGGELVDHWLQELQKTYDPAIKNHNLKDWATTENLEIKGFKFDRAAEFYPQVYERRFRDDPENGYAFLEKIMESREPSFGYSVLAKMLAEGRHQVVITTNFDNLVADALSIYTRTYPLVCGHESLTTFIKPLMSRPLIAKIHRDILLAPQSDPQSTGRLAEGWINVLKNIFKIYTPIVIGYGGNDGSLIGFLGGLQPGDIAGGIRWCIREGDGDPREEIKSIVKRHNGCIYSIFGFDEIMMRFNEILGYGFLADEIEKKAAERADNYRKKVDELNKHIDGLEQKPESREAASALREAFVKATMQKNDWYSWHLRAKAEKDPQKAEAIYEKALKKFPTDAGLIGNYANFMWKIRNDYDGAEKSYKKALELGRKDATYSGNYASFMAIVRKEYDEAERLYKKALELDPENSVATANYAIFMADIRKNYDEAERLYKRALELGPENADNMGNFSGFLLLRGNISESRKLCLKAWKLNKNEIHQRAAEICFYKILLDTLEDKDNSPGLSQLKTIIGSGYLRISWSFDDILESVNPKLSSEDFEFYSAIAEAILDEKKVEKLESIERWKEIEPLPLDIPWED